MLDIIEYIKLPKKHRQNHLQLAQPCIERGGQSTYLKGLLAHLMDTTIPSGKKIHVCHACHNSKCSNPHHLYWGTASENKIDSDNNGRKSIWEAMVVKYGLEEASRIQSRRGNKNGSGNKGKPKSDEHKRKIAENRKGGRPKKASMVELVDTSVLEADA